MTEPDTAITVPGNPFMVGSHPDGLLLMAGGDVKINGNPSGGAFNFEGLIYADSQCEVSGAPRFFGLLICRDAPNPPDSEHWVSENKLNGDMEITYNWGRFMGSDKIVSPIRERSWDQVLH